MTRAVFPSITATQEFVVPKSIPIMSPPLDIHLAFLAKVERSDLTACLDSIFSYMVGRKALINNHVEAKMTSCRVCFRAFVASNQCGKLGLRG